MSDRNDTHPWKPPRVALLSPADLFNGLTTSQKLYAHHMARASWLGTRIILRQVSPESTPIFDFILELHRACAGEWVELRKEVDISEVEMEKFLEYAAVFLQNIGNYYGNGDQKFIPDVSDAVLARLALVSSSARELYSQMSSDITSTKPSGLGYSSALSQTSYYLGMPMSSKEVEVISHALEDRHIPLENTRIRKGTHPDFLQFDVLQASTEEDTTSTSFKEPSLGQVRVITGDHSTHLRKICHSLVQAQQHVDNPVRAEYLSKLLASFETGNMDAYRDSQNLWVEDQQPTIETVIGFVEPYRDPYGVRAEFEGMVGVLHEKETELLKKLVDHADRFIATLPWVRSSSDEGGNGPFETSAMGHRDFSSIHTLAYCSTLVFPGVNLPNYNDIRQQKGFKNIMITNSIDGGAMSGDSKAAYIQPHEAKQFLSHRGQTYYLWVVFHELFGHGTGRMLAEDESGVCNFDVTNPPTNPVTGKPVDSWYLPNQTWTGLFGDIATSVDECRAECIGALLMSNKDLLATCGYTNETRITASDLEYNMYLQLAVAGLRSLENYMVTEQKWGQAHSRGHFAMFRALLEDAGDFIQIQHDKVSQTLTVSVNRYDISTIGRPALEALTLKLHMFRCTADVKGCRRFFEELTKVDNTHLEWRRIVMANSPPKRVFVQPNTFLDGQDVVLKEYEPTIEGVIKSWAERDV